MARKKQSVEVPDNVEIVAETEQIVVCRLNRPVADHFFEKITHQIRSANESTGVKIVVVPYAIDVSFDESNNDENKE